MKVSKQVRPVLTVLGDGMFVGGVGLCKVKMV